MSQKYLKTSLNSTHFTVMENQFVLGLDVGTTTIRAFVYDQKGVIRGHATDRVSLI